MRERTGCSVVAVERGDDVLTDFDDDFHFETDDALYVCGSNAAVRRFKEMFAEA
jgi:K+/H+ antiporter YhaU regulatory subunit KhtT